MGVLIITENGLRRILDYGLQTGTVAFMLFQSNTVFDETTELADLTECDFSGYARENVAVDDATIVGGQAVSDIDPGHFQHDGGATDNPCFGWALIDQTEGYDIIAGKNLDLGEFTFAAPGDFLDVTAEITLGVPV